MAGYDFRSPRLYVEAPLEEGADVALNGARHTILARSCG